MDTNKLQVNNYTARVVQEKDKQYLVVPVVMMLEGVHSGSHGAVLHTSDVLSNNVNAWNGVPVTVGHPTRDGQYISANEKDVKTVGFVRNTKWEDNKLKAEAWLDEQKIIAESPQALQYIKEGRALDVSIGSYTKEISEQGEYNGENYIAVAHGHTPDHLALLPGENGACSWTDGCGVRVNKDYDNAKKLQVISIDIDNADKATNKLNINERKVKPMNKEEKSPCFIAKVDALIANENIKFTEADKEWLLTQTDEVLNKMLPEKKPDAMPEKIEVNKEKAIAVLRETLKKPEDFISLMPDEMQDQMKSGLRLHQNFRKELITKIQTNCAKGTWNDEELNNMDTQMLEKIAKSARATTDYSVNAEQVSSTCDSNEVLYPAGVEIK